MMSLDIKNILIFLASRPGRHVSLFAVFFYLGSLVRCRFLPTEAPPQGPLTDDVHPAAMEAGDNCCHAGTMRCGKA